jgi:glycosyltransferase involved in cell wall biosynthesis
MDVQPNSAAVAPPRVSVIVPLFNGEAFVAETLRSVGAQTLAAFEIIVVDDGSTDASIRVARSAGVPFTLLEQQRSGVSGARNAGLHCASGDYVCFLDQDDIWHLRHLELQLRALSLHPQAGVAVSPYLHWYPVAGRYAEPDAMTPAPPGQDFDLGYSGWVFHQFLLDCWALTSATMIRRDVLMAHGSFDPERPYGEDWELWLRLSLQVPFVKLNWPPVLYRQHAVQGSRLARSIDYRTELLLDAARRHGFVSRDGRAVSRRRFVQRISRFQMEFGCHHLEFGDPGIAVRALLAAWRRDPLRLRYLALALAGAAGWRPRHGHVEAASPGS